MTTRIVGLRDEFLWSLKLLSGKLSLKPNAFRRNGAIGVPSHKPVRSARALCMLRPEISCFSTKLAWLLRVDLYAQIPADGGARFQGLIRRNDELAASMREKDTEIRASQKNEG
jgi:hypothetical protein